MLLFCAVCFLQPTIAQRITRQYNNVSFSAALKDLNAAQDKYAINFVYDELEDFKVSKSIRNMSVPDAIQQLIGFYPIKMTQMNNVLVVECTQKTPTKMIGRIVDTRRRPVDFANVALLNVRDSSFITGGVTNENGQFVIPCEARKAIVKVSCVGYQTAYHTYDTGKIGAITLREATMHLQKLVVKANRPIFKDKGDVITADIEHSVLSQSGTFDKMMNQIPFVSGSDGSYQVFGRGEAQIYINGHKLYNANELQLLGADKIKKVEVVTNPGAKYAADVKAVIKVYTKDNPNGLGGNVMTYMQYGRKFSNFENASVVYNHDKLQVMGGMSFSHTKRMEYAQDNSQILQDGIKQYGDSVRIDFAGTVVNANVGVNYNYSHSNHIGFNTTATVSRMSNDVDIANLYHAIDHIRDFETSAHNRATYKPFGWVLNTYWNSSIRQTRMELTHDLVIGRRRELFDYAEASLSSVATDGVMNYLMSSTIIDLNTKVSSWLSLNYGAELTYSREKQHFGFEEENISTDMQNTGDERKQMLSAAYASMNVHLNKWTLDAGLRYEYTSEKHIKGEGENDGRNRQYHDVFPSLNISVQPAPMANISIGYHAGVKRPSYALLNNNLQYNSRYQYVQGNSQLKAEYTHSLNFLASYRNLRLIGSVEFIKNAIMVTRSIYSDAKGIVLSRSENMPSFHRYSIGVNWWRKFGVYTPYLELNYSQQDFRYAYLGEERTFDHPFISFKVHHTFALPKNITIMAFVDFIGDKYTMFRNHTHRWSTQMSLSKMFAKGWDVQLSANNLFCSGKFLSATYCDWIKDETFNDSDYRNVSLMVSYNFNYKQKKHNARVKSSEINRF